MAKAYESMNDKWRALGYRKAIMALIKCNRPVTSFEVSILLTGDMNNVRLFHENLKWQDLDVIQRIISLY